MLRERSEFKITPLALKVIQIKFIKLNILKKSTIFLSLLLSIPINMTDYIRKQIYKHLLLNMYVLTKNLKICCMLNILGCCIFICRVNTK